MTAIIAFEIVTRFTALLAFVQALEFLSLTRVTSGNGVWRWADLENELCPVEGPFRRFARMLLRDQNFTVLNAARLCFAAWVFILPNPVGLLILLIMHVMTLFRWFGSFNGGSDYMNSIVLLFTTVGLFFPEPMALVALWYIALQACLSYFRAGWIKLRARSWRQGIAVREFLNSPTYERRNLFLTLTKSGVFNMVSAWAVMIFEITFPLSLLNHNVAAGYIVTGFFFHLVNAYVFGLNRFVFAWLATYPALYFCSYRAS